MRYCSVLAVDRPSSRVSLSTFGGCGWWFSAYEEDAKESESWRSSTQEASGEHESTNGEVAESEGGAAAVQRALYVAARMDIREVKLRSVRGLHVLA